MSLPSLQAFGLTENEANLYDLLVRIGQVPVNRIIQDSKLKRPTVYKALYSLEKKGLVSKAEIKKKINFRPQSPTKLFDLAQAQYESLNRAKESLQTILPSLTSAYVQSTEQPVVRIYEGVEGLKTIYKDTLSEGKDIYAILQAGEVEPSLYKWLTTTYVKARAKQKTHAKVIVASSKESKEYVQKDIEEFRTTLWVSSVEFPIQHEVDIYGDKVAFIHYKKGEALIGIVIKHPQIAKTMKAFFDLSWRGAQQAKIISSSKNSV